jgi:hypothetical protein
LTPASCKNKEKNGWRSSGKSVLLFPLFGHIFPQKKSVKGTLLSDEYFF